MPERVTVEAAIRKGLAKPEIVFYIIAWDELDPTRAVIGSGTITRQLSVEFGGVLMRVVNCYVAKNYR